MWYGTWFTETKTDCWQRQFLRVAGVGNTTLYYIVRCILLRSIKFQINLKTWSDIFCWKCIRTFRLFVLTFNFNVEEWNVPIGAYLLPSALGATQGQTKLSVGFLRHSDNVIETAVDGYLKPWPGGKGSETGKQAACSCVVVSCLCSLGVPQLTSVQCCSVGVKGLLFVALVAFCLVLWLKYAQRRTKQYWQ